MLVNEFGKAVSTKCPHCPNRYVTFPSDTDMGYNRPPPPALIMINDL